MISPFRVIHTKYNGKRLGEGDIRSVHTYMSWYALTFFLSSLLLITYGIDWKTSASSVATCMAGIGPGIGSVGPASNFAHLPALVKLFLSLPGQGQMP